MNQLGFFALCLALAAVPEMIQGLNLANVNCGVMGSRNQRSIGGSVANISDFPYAVSIKKGGEHYCGGSLIHQNYVLTAAHCLSGSSRLDNLSITVGEQNRGVKDPREQTIGVAAFEKHRDFQHADDIAIIRLKESVEWNSDVQPICLPDSEDDIVVGKLGLLAGWGLDKEGGKLTEELQFVSLPMMDNSKCQEMINTLNKEYNKTTKIVNQQVCAGYDEGKIDGCKGDSGNGLVTEKDERMVLVGIMSAGYKDGMCGRPNMPGIYTRIPSYIKWIQDTIAHLDDSIERSPRSPKDYWTGVDEYRRLAHLRREVEPPIMLDMRVRNRQLQKWSY